MTNFFANDKTLGFSIIIVNRPFHLFAEDHQSRLKFLNTLTLAKESPQVNTIACIKNKPKYSLLKRSTKKVKIIPYNDYDTVSVCDKIPKRRNRSVKEISEDPFSIYFIEESNAKINLQTNDIKLFNESPCLNKVNNSYFNTNNELQDVRKCNDNKKEKIVNGYKQIKYNKRSKKLNQTKCIL